MRKVLVGGSTEKEDSISINVSTAIKMAKLIFNSGGLQIKCKVCDQRSWAWARIPRLTPCCSPIFVQKKSRTDER